jgi:hypothetical protein
MIGAPLVAKAIGPLAVIVAAIPMQAGLPLDFGSNYLLASALVGVLLPAGIALILQRRWSTEVKGLVAAALCVGAGALVAYTQGVIDRADGLRSILIVFTLAQILYATFWKPSGIAPAIEAATSGR